tara:strand:+ start:2319 stop:2666 length:348 start_codon:yes stop_codon:yes gene_type:complete
MEKSSTIVIGMIMELLKMAGPPSQGIQTLMTSAIMLAFATIKNEKELPQLMDALKNIFSSTMVDVLKEGGVDFSKEAIGISMGDAMDDMLAVATDPATLAKVYALQSQGEGPIQN